MGRFLLSLSVLFINIVLLSAQCAPDETAPAFDAPLPAETLTVCAGDIPDPFSLTAMDVCDGALSAFPTDDTTAVNGVCQGGTIVRTWRVADAAGNEATFIQTITIEADTTPPTSTYVVENVSEVCGMQDLEAWVLTQQSALLAGAMDDCAIASIDNDAPARWDTCATLTVTFTLEDFCGNTTAITADYTLMDMAAPAFDNLPQDLELGCSLSLPEVPEVTATDVCSGIQEILFREDIEQDSTGTLCNNLRVIRTWTAMDGCGNAQVGTQIITLIDTLAPTFEVPVDVLLACNENVDDLNITGNATNLTDDCDLEPTISYRDTLVESQLQRIWTAQDICGNTSFQIQRISINDTIAPTFIVPADLTTDCGDIADLSVTGQPTMVNDNCDAEPEVTYEDIFTAGSCESGGAVQRIWRVRDAAGNVNEQTQRISIIDDEAPIFEMPAQDEMVTCSDTSAASSRFRAWIAAYGNAIATDNCSDTSALVWVAYNSGTTEPAELPVAGCANPELNIYQQRAVDFVVEDECGNTSLTTATFTVTDNIAPTFAYCPPDTVLQTNDSSCSANFNLVPPIVIESCGTFVSSYQYTVRESIASDSPNNRDVPVNTVRLSFPVNPSSNFANADVRLEINLSNVDAEQAPEYFNVMTETGDSLGRTQNVAAQCGMSQTIFTNITAEQINQWAGSNAQVTFFLEPNIVSGQPGRFSINDICGGSEVEGKLTFETLSPSGTTYEYSINNGSRKSFLLETPVFESLTVGINTITYFATDCSGNTGECAYEVEVQDQQPPSIVCPNDTTLMIGIDSCTANLRLPLPGVVLDNCSTGNTNQITLPSDSSNAFITFTFDPDLNDYLADNRTFTFTGLAANALNDVELVISFKGDVDNGNAFFNIFGENGTPLGFTALGQPNVTVGDCNTFSTATFTIEAAIYNNWASDGQVTIQAISNGAIPIPPGGPGDGVNPCDDSVINADGDTDGISQLFATLSYDNTQYEYFATGATTIAPSLIQSDDAVPELAFEVGETTVFYVVEDGNNNRDTCSFFVNVLDEEAPIARCTGTTVSINPSGVDADTLQVIDLDFGSEDNCGIDSSFVFPNVFDCSFVGRDTVNVTLTVVDKSGNRDECTAPVRIIAEKPEPSYFIPPCNGDTLYLFANPPISTGNNVYTYAWSGPQGFASNQQNPIIPNIDEDNAGSYQVTITGITACTAVGIVEVAVNDIPITPDLIVPEKLCSSEDLVLTTSIVPQGVEVVYKWYQGMPSNPQLLGSTTTASLTLSAPVEVGDRNFYVVVEVGGCESSPSAVKTVQVIEQPVAVVIDPNPEPICEGESIELGTFVTGVDLTYKWSGPNGYSSNTQVPPVINNATVDDDGVYSLVICRDICRSQAANVVVTVRPQPQTPNLSITGGRCEGDTIRLRMNVATASVYRWLEPNGNTRTTATNELIVNDITQDLSGPWRGFVTQGGCDSKMSEPLQVTINPTPMLAVSANPNPICEGENLQLSASPTINGATYEWTGPASYFAVGQNPLVNNIRANRTGPYTAKITTSAGCINTQTVEVNVKQSVRITGVSNTASTECITSPTDVQLFVTVFPPDDGTYEYFWEGPNYTSRDAVATIPNATQEDSGDYSVFVSTGEDCSSSTQTTTVRITDAPATPATPQLIQTTQPPFCEGDVITLTTNAYSGTSVEYIWSTPTGSQTTSVPTLTINSADINNQGEYAVMVRINDCESRPSGTIPININTVPEILVISNSPVCEGDQIELETDFIEGATYRWELPGGLTASGTNPKIPNASPDVHNGTVRVKAIINGCESPTASEEVVVNAIPNVPMIVNNSPVCIDAPEANLRLAIPVISSTPGATYTWYDQTFDIISEGTSDLVLTINDFEGYGEGEFAFYAQATNNGCVSERSDATMADFSTIPNNTAYAGEDVTLCEAQVLDLDAATPTIGFGKWTQTNGDSNGIVIANPNDPNTTIFGIENSGEYTFEWQLSSGACEAYSTDEVTILVNPSGTANAGSDIDTCRTTSLRLNATTPLVGRGRWVQSEVQRALGVTIEDVFDANTNVRGLQGGNQYFFTWEILDGTCGDASDEVTVVVSNGFSYAGEDFNDCGDGCVNLNATEPTSGVGEWRSLNDKISFNSKSDPGTLTCNLEIGENVFIWTADNGACGELSRDTVIVNYQPLALAENDTVALAFAGTADIDVVENDNLVAASFTVTVMDMPTSGTLEVLNNGVFRYQADGNFGGVDGFSYELCTAGCECSIAEVRINVGAETACNIPSIITPNNDGINDEFIIPCLNDTEAFMNSELIIFNQWGDEVFRSKNYRNDWRGTYNSEDLPDGTYYYVLQFGDGSKPTSGYVLIQR